LAELPYVGGELELFAQAKNWKGRLARELAPHLGGKVLEVGAGLGGTTESLLSQADVASWSALEPDPDLFAELERKAAFLDRRFSAEVRALRGTLSDLDEDERFDAVLYVDVLEHIEDDRGELTRAAARLERGGKLVVLAPAHQALYSEFDRAIGHFRRYDRRSLAALAPDGMELVTLAYLDSVGWLASLANRWLLRRSMPTAAQIRTWDGVMVPLSGVLDRLLLGRFGKSVLAVWRRAPG
jgi:SAM-dependent methyltransferase